MLWGWFFPCLRARLQMHCLGMEIESCSSNDFYWVNYRWEKAVVSTWQRPCILYKLSLPNPSVWNCGIYSETWKMLILKTSTCQIQYFFLNLLSAQGFLAQLQLGGWFHSHRMHTLQLLTYFCPITRLIQCWQNLTLLLALLFPSSRVPQSGSFNPSFQGFISSSY